MNIFPFRERVVRLESVNKKHTIWESDALLIHVRKGLGRLKIETATEGERVAYSLLLNEKPLITLLSENHYCPTCEKLIKAGYGLQNLSNSLIQDVKESQQPQIEIDKAFELMKPLLSLLENGLYVIAKIDMCPTDGEGNYFWISNEQRYFKATADVYYNFHYGAGWPNFLYPTQPLERLNISQVNYYREQIKKGNTMSGLAFYMDGSISALLDGHHRATAACLEGKKINCLTVMKVNGYQLTKEGISRFWAGGNAFEINTLENGEKIEELLKFYQGKRKQNAKLTDNRLVGLDSYNFENDDLLKILTAKAREYPDYLSVAFKSMLDEISFDKLEQIWSKFDEDSKFEFEILLRVLFREDPVGAYPFLKRIISDSSKREFWEMAYEYLATFKNEEVEDIFINYLLNSEPDKHDKIRKLADEYLIE